MIGGIQTAGDAMQRAFERQRAVQEGIQSQREEASQKVISVFQQAIKGSSNVQQIAVDALTKSTARGSSVNMLV